MKNLLQILFITSLFFSCLQKEENLTQRKITKVEIETLMQDSTLNIRAIEINQERLRSDTFKKRNEIDFETLTESEAQNLLDEMVGLGKQRYDLYNKFILDLKQVLPAKKIILLKKVEEEFKRKMIKEFRKRGSSKSRERP